MCLLGGAQLPVPAVAGGAVERWIHDAARYLADHGHETHVVALAGGASDSKAPASGSPIHWHFIALPPALEDGVAARLARSMVFYTRAMRVVAGLRPDIAHVQVAPTAALAARYRLRGRSGVLVSLHSMDYGWPVLPSGVDRAVFNQGFAACDRILTVSDFIRRHVTERYAASVGKTEVLHNGVDTGVFAPGRPAEAPVSRDTRRVGRPPVILFTGRIEERKGVHVVAEAFESVVRPALPEAELVLIGPHSYTSKDASDFYRHIRAWAQATAGVKLLDPIYDNSELAPLYASADVAALPSVFPEALPLTPLELQACGVPAVVSDAGGMPETVDDGVTGLVVPRGDAHALGAALLRILTGGERERMGLRAREWVEGKFSWSVIGRELVEHYEDVRHMPRVAQQGPRASSAMPGVLFVSSHLNVGGAERLLEAEIPRLRSIGVRPVVCTHYEPGPVGESMVRDGTNVHSRIQKSRWDWRVPLRISRIVREHDIDVIYVVMGDHNSMVASLVAGALRGRPVIVAVHNTNRRYRLHHATMLLRRFLLGRCRLVVGVADSHAAYLCREYRLSPERVRVVHNGIDVAEFDRRMSQPNTPVPVHDGPIVAITAQLRPEKAHSVFLAAASEISGHRPDARFWIIGDGPEHAAVESEVRRLGLSSVVSLLGQRGDVPSLLCHVDVVMLTSDPFVETYPVAIIEAMAASRPVVATDVGCLRDLVAVGDTGFLAGPRDSHSLAESTVRLLDDRDLASRMGSAGRAKVEAELTLDTTVGDLVAVLSEVLGGGPNFGRWRRDK